MPLRASVWLMLAVALFAGPGAAAPKKGPKPFVDEADAQLRRLGVRVETAEWIKNTYITPDTAKNAATLRSDYMAFIREAMQAASTYRRAKTDPQTERLLKLLRTATSLPAPGEPKKREELANLAAQMDSLYGKGKWCGAEGKSPCRDLQALTDVMANSRDYQVLLDAWAGWHTISRPMKPMYSRYVELANEGARDVGFANVGELWRSNYELSPADFEKELERLWTEVRPLYEQLHCYVRAKLSEAYGPTRVPPTGPMPAHVLGNMWAQEWPNIYPLVEPHKGVGNLDVTAALKEKKYDATKMVKLGEGFFTSLGFDPLPETFWQRSLFKKPQDRDVVCHASAWDVSSSGDLRIKMCIEVNEDDLVTIHHELGHVFYFQAYQREPRYLFQQGANDGFHEAVGDAIALSVNRHYLNEVGILPAASEDPRAELNALLKEGLERIAFLPFGKLIDQWRWDVFAGKVDPARYNQHWWELRRKYQGVAPPVPRTEQDFDPGAKYHIPANVPYSRYFLARILQFQFHRAMCQAAGHRGPLHTCSVYGSKEAGAKLKAMLALGASKPWPEALQALTGESRLDSKALLDYFAPLAEWLAKQNQGRQCGW